MKNLMPRQIIFLILVTVALSSCKKESVTEHPEYIGTWVGNQGYSIYGYGNGYGEQEFEIYSDGTAYFYIAGAVFLENIGEVKISKSHLQIGITKFEILSPPTQLDPTSLWIQLGSSQMILKYTGVFGNDNDVFILYKQ